MVNQASDLRITVYDSNTHNRFVAKVIFNIASPVVTAILDVSCTEESSVGAYYFACALVSGTHSLSELYFEINPSTYSVRKVNETAYYRFKDFGMLSVKMNGSFIVGPAVGISQSESAVVVYRRVSHKGSLYLYGGIGPETYNYEDIRTMDVELYNGDSIVKVILQPKEGKTAYIYRLDNLKLVVHQLDLAAVQAGTILPNGSTSFSIKDAFTEGLTGSGGSSSTGTTDAANSSSNTGLLIGLIVAVVVVLLGIAAIIAYVIWKQGKKTKNSQYRDSQRDVGTGNTSQTNLRSFDGVKY